MDIEALQKELKEFFESQGLKSSLSIANQYGMVQSTVYRNLFEAQVSMTPSLKKLCNYAGIDYSGYGSDNAKRSEIIMDAVQQVWDGTEAHAKKIRRLLLAAHSCKICPK